MKHYISIALIAVLFSFFVSSPIATVQGEPIPSDAGLTTPLILTDIPDEYRPENRFWQGIPSIEATSNDRLWATWYTGNDNEEVGNYVVLATSADKGQTWIDPVMVILPPVEGLREFDSGLWMDPNGRLWFYWSQSGGLKLGIGSTYDGRAGVWLMTTDNPEDGENAQWTAPRRISDGVMLNKPVVTTKGRWLLPISYWEGDGKPFSLPEEKRGAGLWETKDEGKTFEFVGNSRTHSSTAVEHHILEMKDGSLKLFARTKDGISVSATPDDGKTWPDMEPYQNHTVSRFFIRRLQSGNLLLVRNGKCGVDVERSDMTAMISTDDGKTWSDGILLFSEWEVSYPDALQTEDGTIYIIYDWNRFNEGEVFIARLTEEDILAGKIVTEGSTVCQRISKVHGREKQLAAQEKYLTQEQKQTLQSARLVGDRNNIYEINYTADYKLDEILEATGAEVDRYGDTVQKTILPDSILAPPSAAVRPFCSAFAAKKEDGAPVMGRNFDFRLYPAIHILLHTAPQNGYASVGMADLGVLNVDPLSLRRSLPSKERFLLSPMITVDGVNEKGFSIAALIVTGEPACQNRGKKTIPSYAVVRYMLDHAASVEDAIALFDQLDVRAASDSKDRDLHWVIADASGDSAVVEILKDRTSVVRGTGPNNGSIATNFYRTEGAQDTAPRGKWRAEQIKQQLQEHSLSSDEDAMEILRSVAYSRDPEAAPRIGTLWSEVFDLKATTVKISFYEQYDEVYPFKVNFQNP